MKTLETKRTRKRMKRMMTMNTKKRLMYKNLIRLQKNLTRNMILKIKTRKRMMIEVPSAFVPSRMMKEMTIVWGLK
jgi:hypothetical protein